MLLSALQTDADGEAKLQSTYFLLVARLPVLPKRRPLQSHFFRLLLHAATIDTKNLGLVGFHCEYFRLVGVFLPGASFYIQTVFIVAYFHCGTAVSQIRINFLICKENRSCSKAASSCEGRFSFFLFSLNVKVIFASL